MPWYAPGAEGLLQPLAMFLQDPEISEIIINRPKEIWVEKQGKFSTFSLESLTALHLHRLCQLIANENGKKLSPECPLLSGNLPDGARVQIVIPPVSASPVFAIRKKVLKNFSLEDYRQSGFYHMAHQVFIQEYQSAQSKQFQDQNQNQKKDQKSYESQKLYQLYQSGDWALFIHQAIQTKKNIIISGGTSSGKTTYLTACLQAIDPSERLLILEDTQEVETPHLNQVRLLTQPGVSMQSLVQASLRLRPDRILMGEIRGKEIMDFIGACATGHEGGMTTIHANSPAVALMRMTQMYKLNAVPSMTDQDILREIQMVIDIIIQINKTPSGRKVQGIYFKY